jgi:CDGSH-type Zn-finger protein/truncated hemoglobin YjbI
MSRAGGAGPYPSGSISAVATLLADAGALVARLPGAGGDWAGVAERLRDSVVRPLQVLVGPPGPDGPPPGHAQTRAEVTAETTAPLAEALWGLATAATRLCADPEAAPELAEATAALQDLVAGPGAVARPAGRTEDVLAELARLQAGAPAGIRVSRDGPYLLTGVEQVTDHLGVPVPVTPTMALCRCGGSGRKPLCDGTHAKIGFSGAKHPERVADRRDSYAGVRVTVLDNRGLCQHSGFCTDRLASVFHAGSEPFVTPSGGRMDEIVAAARACPSGALSYAVEGREAREQVDQARPPRVEVSKDGPYRVTGAVALLGPDGRPEPRAEGASAEHYALCRCGQSRNKPFCSGMHYYAGFADPPAPEQATLFEWAGGLPALLAMTRIFYGKHVPADDLLAPLFAEMSPDHPERVAAWLAEVFGGPAFYSSTYGGYPRMISEHVGKQLTEAARARWVTLLARSAAEAGLPQDAEFAAAFTGYLEWGSRIAVENSQSGARPPESMPMPRWWWVCNATPDARVSALAPPVEPEPEVALPGPDEPVSYAAHIRPLFRAMDRGAMRFAFDLWSRVEVAEHAEAILARLRTGSMPCDGAWPPEWVAVFARWMDDGKPE